MSNTKGNIGFIIALSLFATPLAAQHETGHEVEGHEISHAHPVHAIGVFVGGARADQSNEVAIGVEYEARIASWFGIGAVGESVPGAHHSDGTKVALAGVHLHPYKGLRITGAVGAEFVGGAHSKRETLYRLGGAYDIPLGHWGAIAPTFSVDFVDHKRVPVFGTAFLVHF